NGTRRVSLINFNTRHSTCPGRNLAPGQTGRENQPGSPRAESVPAWRKTRMSKADFSEYEKRRAEQHEELCRATSSLMCIRGRICRLRTCRRRRVCCGPMLPSPHQAWAVRAQREIGLSGKACAELPFCVANQAPRIFEGYKRVMDGLRQVKQDWPEMDLVRACVERATGRRHSKKLLTSLSRHPTSGNETKG
ncbi:hypothetical protein ACFFP0_28460, partial [Rhizobium puerariae]